MLTSTINPYPEQQSNSQDKNQNHSPQSRADANITSGNLSSNETHPHPHPHPHPHLPSKAFTRRKTKSEDLHILAHAQGQLREHLEPGAASSRTPSKFRQEELARYSQAQQEQPHWYSQSLTTHQYPQQRHPQYLGHGDLNSDLNSNFMPSNPNPRPHSAHQFSHAHAFPPTLHAPTRYPPPWYWSARGTLESGVEPDDDNDNDAAINEASVVESIEVDPVSPRTPCPPRDSRSHERWGQGLDEEARTWEDGSEAHGSGAWNGYVRQKESWVRRAGLKRSTEDLGEGGGRKKGRVEG